MEKVRLAKSVPRFVPRPRIEAPIQESPEVALLKSIDQKLSKPLEVEKTEVVFPKVQKVEVTNQEKCEHEMPKFPEPTPFPSEIRVSNLPETQPVVVENLPEGASTEAAQEKILAAIKKIEETLKALKFTEEGELKTTGKGGNDGFYGVATAANQLAEMQLLTSLLGALEGVLDIRELTFATDKVDVSGSSVTANATAYIVRYDDAGSGITYIGKAVAGTAVGSAAWQIFRLDESSTPDFTKLYADGVSTFTKIWDNRASYTYS